MTSTSSIALTGCSGTTSSNAEARPTASETPHAAAAASTAPDTPPQLLDAQKTFITAGGKTGSYEFPAISEIQRGTLEIAAICSGSGTIDVKVGSFIGFTVRCGNGDPGEFNEDVLSQGRKDVAVSVTSRTSGSWGLSVGWTKVVEPHERG